MNPAALLPHESICPGCKGEKVVECSGVHPSRSGSVSQMESPDEWTERCAECDGCGVVLDERRATERDSASDLYRAFVALRRALSISRLDAEELRMANDRLVTENREFRRSLHEWGRVLEAAR